MKMTKIIDLYKKYKLEKYIYVICILLWSFLTISSHWMTRFNYDEIHSWNIAANLNIIEIIKLMRAEGHTFIWYTILKPFTYFPDIFFPYILKLINWLFMLGTIVILCFFCPINIFLKLAFIFSYPMSCLYPVEGRPYGMGIFFLMLAVIMYKNRLSCPYKYSTVLLILSNTSVLGAFSGLILGLLFFIDLIKVKDLKKLIISGGIMLVTLILLIIQWYNPLTPLYIKTEISYKRLITFLFGSYKFIASDLIMRIFYILLEIFTVFYFRKELKILFFILVTSFAVLLLNCMIYPLFDYHFYHVFIYLIFGYILKCINSKSKKFDFYTFILIVLCLLHCSYFRSFSWEGGDKFLLTKQSMIDKYERMSEVIPDGVTVYIDSYKGFEFIPFMYKDKRIYKNFNGINIESFDNFINQWQFNYNLKNTIDTNKDKNSYLILIRSKKNLERYSKIVQDLEYFDSRNTRIYKLK